MVAAAETTGIEIGAVAIEETILVAGDTKETSRVEGLVEMIEAEEEAVVLEIDGKNTVIKSAIRYFLFCM